MRTVKERKRFVLILPLVSILFSCNRITASNENPLCSDVGETTADVIPIEDALATLDKFMMSTNMTRTKAGSLRSVLSVETHYSKTARTKSGELLPDAYIVNFEEADGFAVLGANTLISDIVCVVENGNIDAQTLDIALDTLRLTDPLYVPDFDLDCKRSIQQLIYNSLYSQDIYLDGNSENSDETSNVDEIADGDNDFNIDIPEGNSADDSSSSHENNNDEQPQYPVEQVPLTYLSHIYNLGQKSYDSYCYAEHRSSYYAANIGCGPLAVIETAILNEWPVEYSISGTNVDSENHTDESLGPLHIYSTVMKYYPNYIARYLTDYNIQAQELDGYYNSSLKMLYGAIFHKVSKNLTFLPDRQTFSTGVSGLELKRLMISLGYINVRRTGANFAFAKWLRRDTHSMVSSGKPVIVGGNKWFGSGHWWVIDADRNTPESNYIVHCIWGWYGQLNGWFSSSCFNPTSAREYDDDTAGIDMDDFDYRYSVLYELLTYDIPAAAKSAEMNFRNVH